MNTIQESQMPVQPYSVNLLRLTLLVIGAIYYTVAIRGHAADIESDEVTGEATIG